LGGTVAAVAAACGVGPRVQEPTAKPEAPATDEPATEEPSPIVTPILLRNENQPADLPDWNIRFIQPVQALDRDAWELEVAGLVEEPTSFTWEEIQALEAIEQNTRMVCVEGWSRRAVWTGFVYRTLAQIVRPTSEATWVRFECGDGYYEVLSVEELDRPGMLFAHGVDGEPLHPKLGAPLRLIVPDRYGYKGPKTIVRVEFMDEGGRGYWSTVGPYTRDGHIQPGLDRPLDLDSRPRTIDGGEVTEY
jgi:DMSO/TMAO reductase YedYZ molybdopterin-dependent catalytic subunit